MTYSGPNKITRWLRFGLQRLQQFDWTVMRWLGVFNLIWGAWMKRESSCDQDFYQSRTTADFIEVPIISAVGSRKKVMLTRVRPHPEHSQQYGAKRTAFLFLPGQNMHAMHPRVAQRAQQFADSAGVEGYILDYSVYKRSKMKKRPSITVYEDKKISTHAECANFKSTVIDIEQIVEYLDTTGVQIVMLVGHSLGGLIALEAYKYLALRSKLGLFTSVAPANFIEAAQLTLENMCAKWCSGLIKQQSLYFLKKFSLFIKFWLDKRGFGIGVEQSQAHIQKIILKYGQVAGGMPELWDDPSVCIVGFESGDRYVNKAVCLYNYMLEKSVRLGKKCRAQVAALSLAAHVKKEDLCRIGGKHTALPEQLCTSSGHTEAEIFALHLHSISKLQQHCSE